MKLVRYGPPGREKPGLIDADGKLRDLSRKVKDIGPGALSEGYVLDDEVECPFHQGRFHIPTGHATCAPATDPLKTWKVEVVDDRICINPDEPEQATGGK